jgi:hypothetical protein
MKQRETSRIGKILAIGLCVLIVYFFGYLHGKRGNVLYTAYFRVVDSESKAPIDAHFTFSDRMDIWRKGDDSGGVTVTLPDGTRSVSWMGRRSSSRVRLPLYVDGYGDGFVELHPHDGGFGSIPNEQVTIIELEAEAPKQPRAEQVGADQPATAPESKAE